MKLCAVVLASMLLAGTAQGQSSNNFYADTAKVKSVLLNGVDIKDVISDSLAGFSRGGTMTGDQIRTALDSSARAFQSHFTFAGGWRAYSPVEVQDTLDNLYIMTVQNGSTSGTASAIKAVTKGLGGTAVYAETEKGYGVYAKAGNKNGTAVYAVSDSGTALVAYWRGIAVLTADSAGATVRNLNVSTDGVIRASGADKTTATPILLLSASVSDVLGDTAKWAYAAEIENTFAGEKGSGLLITNAGDGAALRILNNSGTGIDMVSAGAQSPNIRIETDGTAFYAYASGVVTTIDDGGVTSRYGLFDILRVNGDINTAGVVTGSALVGDGSAVTYLNADNLKTGTVGTARLGSGTANSTTFLRGDNTWAVPEGTGGSSGARTVPAYKGVPTHVLASDSTWQPAITGTSLSTNFYVKASSESTLTDANLIDRGANVVLEGDGSSPSMVWHNGTDSGYVYVDGTGEVNIWSKALNATTTLTKMATQWYPVAISDETSNLTTGVAKVTFRMPYAATFLGIRLNVNTAPTGQIIYVDVNESGGSLFSTRPSIDIGEKTSVTAATPYVINDATLLDDAEMTIDIDQVGSGTAGKGLKVWLLWRR